MKPATRSSARSRPGNLDVSSQLELFASLPTPPPAEASVQAEPEPPAEPPAPNSPAMMIGTEPTPPEESDNDLTPTVEEQPPYRPQEFESRTDATDFDTALLEAMTTMPEQIPPEETAASADDETLSQTEAVPETETWVQPDAMPEEQDEVTQAPEVTPAPEKTKTPDDLFDPFESDPFFADNSVPAESSRHAAIKTPAPAPVPSAEERLLDSIVSKPADTTEPVNLQAIAQATERDRVLARMMELEKELATVRDQMAKESQLRRAEATRFAATEREWARKSLASTGGTMNRPGAIDEEGPQHSRAPVIAMTLVALMAAAGLAFFAGRSCGSSQETAAAVSPPEVPAEAAIEATPPPAPVVTPPQIEPRSTTTPWPLLEGKGFKTARTGNTLSIRFNYGVFARGTEMTGAACQDLRRIASTLTPSGKQLRIEVEGHTDAAPVSSGRPYAGNHELGLSRAKVVAEYLSKQCGLPADILKVTSAGEANPPFPNTTAESRKLNRTVVLKLTKVNE